MSKIQTLKGFRDFSPEKMLIRNKVLKITREVFELYGFEELMTPSLEYQDVLLGKYGEEAEKLMYLFEDGGGRKVGLKYDLTVPLARYISENQNMPLPFKRFQIQPVWRADKPQKGRYREFYQCDIDTVGSDSPVSDAEIMAVISEVVSRLGFKEYKIKVNSRQVLFNIIKNIDSNVDKLSIVQSIDKLDKKTKGDIKAELKEKGLSDENIKLMFANIDNCKPDEYLESVIDYAKQMGAENIVFEPTLARGLDYYTGPIFETVVDKPNIGSITGGGRYDTLLKTLGGPDLPAVGTTLGLDRIVDVIEENKLWEGLQSTYEVMVTVYNSELVKNSIEIANSLRNNGLRTMVYFNSKDKLGKQIKYAHKKAVPLVVIVGPDEIKNNKAAIKNMSSGEQIEIEINDIAQKIKKLLS